MNATVEFVRANCTNTESRPILLPHPGLKLVGDTEPSGAVAELFGSLRPVYTRALVYIVVFFVLSALLWAGLVKVDVVSQSPFRLVPLGQLNTVQAPRGGEVEQIRVTEGDRVEGGQVLFRLRSRETLVELRELEQAKVQFLKAEYDYQQALPKQQHLTREMIESLESRLKIIQALTKTHEQAVDAYRADSEKSSNDKNNNPERTKLEAEILFHSEEHNHLRQRYESNKKLYENRLISRSALDEARVQYFSALAELPNRMDEIHRMETTGQDLKRQILEAQIRLNREAAAVRHAFEEARLRYQTARQAVDRALESDLDLILAPEAGVITRVFVNTLGQVVSKGQTLAKLAAANVPIVAEALISGNDVGRIRPGQVVRLKYDSFPFDRYGIKRGRLLKVAPDATDEPTLGPVFRGIVELEESTIYVNGKSKRLMYGMKGSAEIVTDRKTVLDILLRPLRRFRESEGFSSQEED